jgi:hypothetical protein
MGRGGRRTAGTFSAEESRKARTITVSSFSIVVAMVPRVTPISSIARLTPAIALNKVAATTSGSIVFSRAV